MTGVRFACDTCATRVTVRAGYRGAGLPDLWCTRCDERLQRVIE